MWTYGSEGVADRPSKEIFGDCPWSDLNNYGQGFFVFEDFMAGLDTTEMLHPAFRKVDPDTATLSYGTGHSLKIATNTTADDEFYAFIPPVQSVGSGKKMWLEARIAMNDVTNGDGSMVFGLCESSMQAENAITNSHAIGSFDFVGFRILDDDNDSIEAVSVLAGMETAVKADADVAVVDTFAQLGLKIDGETVTFYVDGTVVGTQTISSDYYDLDEDLGVIFGVKTDQSATMQMSVDWIAFGAEL